MMRIVCFAVFALAAASPATAFASRPAAEYWSGSDTGDIQRLVMGLREGAPACSDDCVRVLVSSAPSHRAGKSSYAIEISRDGRSAWVRGSCALDAIDECARKLRSRVDFQIRRLGAK
jgi:hypothetical protein